MVARRLALLREATAASADYVKRFGRPKSWNALDGHRMIGFRSSATGGVLPLEFMVAGTRKTVMLPMTLSVNGADTYRAAALQGLGLIQAPRYALEEDFERGRLVELLRETSPSPTPVSILYPRNRQLSQRVRTFIDWVAKEFAAQSL